MPSTMIRVSVDVKNFINKSSKEVNDTYDSVLRRLLRMKAKKPVAVVAKVKKSLKKSIPKKKGAKKNGKRTKRTAKKGNTKRPRFSKIGV